MGNYGYKFQPPDDMKPWPPRFKSARQLGVERKPVRGGRAEVRKLPHYNDLQGVREERWKAANGLGRPKPWYVRFNGKAEKFNLLFTSHENAIIWAQVVLQIYPQVPRVTMTQMRQLALMAERDRISWVVTPENLITGKVKLVYLKNSQAYKEYKEKQK